MTAIELAVSGDASSEITLFGLGYPPRHERLVTALRADERPRLEALLLPDELFIDLGSSATEA